MSAGDFYRTLGQHSAPVHDGGWVCVHVCVVTRFRLWDCRGRYSNNVHVVH